MQKWILIAQLMLLPAILFAEDDVKQVNFQKEWNETAREIILNEVADDFYDVLLLTEEKQDIFRADLPRTSFFVVPAADGNELFSVVKAGLDDWLKLPVGPSFKKAGLKGKIRPERSSMVMVQEEPILVLNSYQSIHYFVRERVSYFSLAADTLRFLGSLDLRKVENDEFMGLYDGDGITRKLSLTSDSLEQIYILTNLDEQSFSSFNIVNARYQERYLLSHNGLTLISTASEKEAFAVEPQAQSIMQTIKELYNTDTWLDDGSSGGKERQRAQYFLQSFDNLSRLLPTFAPAHFQLAKMHAILGDQRRAAESLQEALRLDQKLRSKAQRDAYLSKIKIEEPVPVVIEKREAPENATAVNRES
ncbi:MAG: hypothetical protein ACRBF0_11405 [Calditrichia bacterium]